MKRSKGVYKTLAFGRQFIKDAVAVVFEVWGGMMVCVVLRVCKKSAVGIKGRI